MILKLACVECNAPVPAIPSDEDSTFTSSKGWRLHLRIDDQGRRVPEWRCPQCWAGHRAKLGH